MKKIKNITEEDRRYARVSRLAYEMKITRSVLQDEIDKECKEQLYAGQFGTNFEKALDVAIKKLGGHWTDKPCAVCGGYACQDDSCDWYNQ